MSSNDWLFGESGNDFIVGGSLDDLLVGGAGNDLYGYTSPTDSGFDSVFDFNIPGTDKFLFTAAEFGMSSGTALINGANFIAEPQPLPAAAAPTMLYSSTLGFLYFDSDGTGQAAPVSLAQIAGSPVLLASDFLFV